MTNNYLLGESHLCRSWAFLNSKSRIIDGEYTLIFPKLVEFLNILESSLCFVSIRSGIADLACSSSTSILAIYGDSIWKNFSLEMWPKKENRKIIEITEKEFSCDVLDDLISQ